jgi:hypothetical protein
MSPANNGAPAQTNGSTMAAANGETLLPANDGLFPAKRERKRHTFDVFGDQLWALDDLQRALWRRSGQKPTLSALVQEALDRYLRDMMGQLSS